MLADTIDTRLYPASSGGNATLKFPVVPDILTTLDMSIIFGGSSDDIHTVYQHIQKKAAIYRTARLRSKI
jgi:hypothetical protein